MGLPAKRWDYHVRGPEVYVGRLSQAMTKNKLHEVFSDCGEISEIRLIKDQNGNIKGFGFVRFATKESAEKAVKEKSGIVLDGKKIVVVPSNERNTLYFGNLNKGWSAHEFERLLRQVCPDVVYVDLVMQQTRSGEKPLNRGCALVKFSSNAERYEVDPDAAKVKIAVIRNLPTNSNEYYLRKLFEPFGEIIMVLVSDKGSSPVGYVTFARRAELEVAIKEMDTKVVQGPYGGLTSILSVKAAPIMEKRAREESESKPPSFNANYVSENTPSAYSIVRSSIIPPTTDQQEVSYGDPYEAAVLALPGFVKERLLLILRATRSDIDIHTLNSLKELTPTAAISVLDQFMLSVADTEDKGIYLAGLIFKHHIDKHMRNELPGSLSRLSERDSFGLSSHSSRDHLSADVSRPSHMGTTLPRSYDYVRHSAASAIRSHYHDPVSTTTTRTSNRNPKRTEPDLFTNARFVQQKVAIDR